MMQNPGRVTTKAPLRLESLRTMTVENVPRLTDSKLKQFQTQVAAAPVSADADALLLQRVQDAYSDFASGQERNKQSDDAYLQERANPTRNVTRNSGGKRLQRARKLKVAEKYLAQAR